MVAITLTCPSAGNPDAEDRRTFKAIVDAENVRRAKSNLAPLPASTANERRTSYELILGALVTALHKTNAVQSATIVEDDPTFKALRGAWADATPAQKAAAQAALPSIT